MARLPRLVLPGVPHHITQRGNRRERTFFEDGDYALYLDLLAQAAEQAHTQIWSYCLMPNHVHIINYGTRAITPKLLTSFSTLYSLM
jgi:putative transposase